jgi:hypothetical protein
MHGSAILCDIQPALESRRERVERKIGLIERFRDYFGQLVCNFGGPGERGFHGDPDSFRALGVEFLRDIE